MNSQKQTAYTIFIFFILIILSACNTAQTPTNTNTPEPIAVATATATHTPSPSPAPSKTPTVIPLPTITPTATPTATPSPTATIPAPEFSNLITALDYDHDANEPLSPRDFFPLGVGYIAAIFDYDVSGWTELQWSITDEKEKFQASGKAGLNTGSGKKAFIMYPEMGLDEGTYELTFKLDKETVLERPFTVYWAPTIWPVSIGEVGYENGEVDQVNVAFPAGTETLYASYPTINFSVGDEISAIWFVNGSQLGTHEYVWDNTEWSSGTHLNQIDNQQESDPELPSGHYELFVSVNGTPTQCKTFEIFETAASTVEPSDRCQAVQDNANPATSADTWRRYKQRTFAEVDDLTLDLMDIIDEEHVIYIESSPEYQYPSSIRVKYTGEYRDTSPIKLEAIKMWAANFFSNLSSEEVEAMFAQEALFKEDSTEYWLPVQSQIIPYLEDEIEPGSYARVFVVWMGAVIESGEIERIYLLNEFWQ